MLKVERLENQINVIQAGTTTSSITPGFTPDYGGVRVANLFSDFCVVIFILFVFVLCLVCQILPVSLDYSFLIDPSVFSNDYLLDIYILIDIIKSDN